MPEMYEEASYRVLKQMADNMVQINKSITPSEWDAARERVAELEASGKRLDGAPKTASIYGVAKRPSPRTMEQLIADLEASGYAEHGGDQDAGEDAGSAGETEAQEDGYGVAEGQASADREREQADQQAGADDSGAVKPIRRRRRLTDETVRQLWQRHKAGERTVDLAAEVGCSSYTLNCRWRALYGAQKRRRKDGPTDEERARIQQEYAAGKTYNELKAEYAVGTSTLVNILKNDTSGAQAAEQRIAELEAQIADYKDRLRRAAALLRGLDIIGRWMEDGLDDAGCDTGGRAQDV